MRRRAWRASLAWNKQQRSSCFAGVSCMRVRTPSGGAMLAVDMNADEARAVIARHDRTVSIAAFQQPSFADAVGVEDFTGGHRRRAGVARHFARFMQSSYPLPSCDDATRRRCAQGGARRSHNKRGIDSVLQHGHGSASRWSVLRCRLLGARCAGARGTASAIAALSEFGVDAGNEKSVRILPWCVRFRNASKCSGPRLPSWPQRGANAVPRVVAGNG